MNKRKAEAKYRLTLSTAIIENRDAVFYALMHVDRQRLDVKLAEFLLQEAGWPTDEFMASYVSGELDD